MRNLTRLAMGIASLVVVAGGVGECGFGDQPE